jgi:hypothetical protein
VDYYVDVVQENPVALLQAFHAQGFDPGLPQGLLQVLGQGLNVSLGGSGTDDEIVSETGKTPDIKNQRLNAFMIHQGAGRQFHHFLGG